MSGLVDGALAGVRAAFPQGALAIFGVLLLALVPVGLLWSRLDRREIEGESVAAKPTKFLLSIGVHALTLSWAFNDVQADRYHAALPQLTVWIVIVSSVWELACIVSQAALGRRSHFNLSTRYDSLLFASMGFFATMLVAANLPLAWEIVWRPAVGVNPTMTIALILGLVASCLVGGGTGILMGVRNAHGVGRETARLPLLGWSVASGDIRVPHFLGIHAVQVLPAAAALSQLASRGLATMLFGFAATLYALLTAATLAQALHGHPLVPAARIRRRSAVSVK